MQIINHKLYNFITVFLTRVHWLSKYQLLLRILGALHLFVQQLKTGPS